MCRRFTSRSNRDKRSAVVLMSSRRSRADSSLPFQVYKDSTGLGTTLTHAARRFSTTARAIFRARASDGQVTRTIRAFLPFARVIPFRSPAPHINDFFRMARKAKITRHEHTRWMERPFSRQVWYFGLARGHCRRFHLRERAPRADGHRGTRESEIRRAHNPGD